MASRVGAADSQVVLAGTCLLKFDGGLGEQSSGVPMLNMYKYGIWVSAFTNKWRLFGVLWLGNRWNYPTSRYSVFLHSSTLNETAA
jgi:hypothetical protein